MDLAALHCGKVILAYPDTPRKFLLCHIEAAKFTNTSSNRFPIDANI
jgi:hypothetical protein